MLCVRCQAGKNNRVSGSKWIAVVSIPTANTERIKSEIGVGIGSRGRKSSDEWGTGSMSACSPVKATVRVFGLL